MRRGVLAPLHRGAAEIHLRTDIGRDFVRQQIGDPDHPAARLAIGDDLDRRAVLLHPLADHRINQPPPLFVAVDK
jgi:hypothetical protein